MSPHFAPGAVLHMKRHADQRVVVVPADGLFHMSAAQRPLAGGGLAVGNLGPRTELDLDPAEPDCETPEPRRCQPRILLH